MQLCRFAVQPPGLILLLILPLVGQPSPESFDVVIKNGKVVDGTGNSWFLGDIGIRADRIARITHAGGLSDARAPLSIDATGLIVAPGFIDIQSHSRGDFLVGDGRVVSKVSQGITTEIMGEGSTNAPSGRVEQIGDRSYDFTGAHGFNAWLEAMQEHGASPNFGSFVGATTIRTFARGQAQGAPSEQELSLMRRLVRNAMEDGAFGFATALIYPPGNFAGTHELVEMAKAMAPYGGIYITHMRSEADLLLEAIDEAIEIGREGGVPVEIYHLKAAGKRNWHKTRLAISRIEAARDEGLDIGANMYPYLAGGTGLTACTPPWASADGKLFANLADPEMRARIKSEILNQKEDWENLCQLATPEGVLLLGLEQPENRKYAGKRLAEVAAELQKDWIETMFDLILSERQRIGTIYFMMTEENLDLQLQQPWIKFGTDAGGADPDRAGALVHPRSYGTFPRILGRYVRDRRVIPLEDAVRKMTSAVADRLSIPKRGLLREDYFADLVIFDFNTIADNATYEQPHQLSSGVLHVLVNGVPVIANGVHTGAKPGRIVRGPGYGKRGE